MNSKWLVAVACLFSRGESGMLAAYFDIPVQSPPGTEVTGRINLEENRFVPGVPIPGNVTFEIRGGTGAQVFSVAPLRDLAGRVFGVIRLKPGQSVDSPGEHTLQVVLAMQGTPVDSGTVTVHVHPQTYLERIRKDVEEFVEGESRMWGRRDYSDNQVEALIDMLEGSQGIFTDINYADPGNTTLYGDNLEEIAIRLGGLGRAFAFSKVYGKGGSNPAARGRLKSALYSAVEAYVDRFPLKGFPTNQAIVFNDRSHQWRFTDPFVGMAVHLYPALKQDMIGAAPSLASQANRVYEKILQLNSLAFELTTEENQNPTDLKRFNGAWADANRFHRMRTWFCLMTLLSDYNRPITYVGYWYPGSGRPGFQLLPGWTPSGSFADMRTWIKTNHREIYRYGEDGFLPDGTISHHSSNNGQQMAMHAYGFEWLTQMILRGMDWFSDSPWQSENREYDLIADRLLFPYARIVYKDGLDMVTSGRSFLDEDLSQFGSKHVSTAIDRLIAAKSKTTLIAREAGLRELAKAMSGRTHEYSGNIPFWNADFMVHRRGGQGESPYYMSVKMISARTRGMEEFTTTGLNYHSGDGFFQVLRDGREYDRTRFDWDWHALPGVTAEFRTDALPSNRTPFKEATGANTFAGVVSDGRFGLAAFEYRRRGAYSTASADKAYFFSDREAVCLGSQVKRTQPGQNRPILTTLNQTRWSTDVTYDLGDGAGTKTIARGLSGTRDFAVSKVAWFQQDGIGYVIIPDGGPKRVKCVHGDAVNATEPGSTGDVSVFHLAIDHGTDPDGTGASSNYAYVVIPNIVASDMPQYIERLGQRLEIIRNDRIKAVHFKELKMAQASFHAPGAISWGGRILAVDQPALVMVREEGGSWQWSVSDPHRNPSLSQISITTSIAMKPGIYRYRNQGIIAQDAESVVVSRVAGGSTLAVQLPDAADELLYGYREEMYAGMPIHVGVPDITSGTRDIHRGKILRTMGESEVETHIFDLQGRRIGTSGRNLSISR